MFRVIIVLLITMTLGKDSIDIPQGVVKEKWYIPNKYDDQYYIVANESWCIKIEYINKGVLTVEGYEIPRDEWTTIKLGQDWRAE